MRRYGLMLLLLLLLLAISACSRIPEVVDVAYRKITIFEAPQQIRDMLESTREQESASVYVVDRVVYIVITRGEQMTGGYGVNVTDIDKYILGEDRFGITVKVVYTDPKPGQPVTQAITYPFVIVETELIDIPMDTQFRFRINGRELVEYPVSL